MIKKLLGKFWKPERRVNPKSLHRVHYHGHNCAKCGDYSRLSWSPFCPSCEVEYQIAHECKNARCSR